MIRLPSITVLLAIIFLGLIAGETGRLTGIVKNDPGQRLENAVLQVKIGGKSFEVHTDAEGIYELQSVPIGNYTIEFRTKGHRKTKFEEIKILDGLTTEINVNLTRR